MRFLGIDYGTKRIGLAISDENHSLAFPKSIIPNDKEALDKIGAVIKEENAEEIVIGEPADFSGAPNAVSPKVEAFIAELEKRFSLKISRQKEFLTSVEARKSGKTKADFYKPESHSKMKKETEPKADAKAAALILQRFLDRFNNEN